MISTTLYVLRESWVRIMTNIFQIGQPTPCLIIWFRKGNISWNFSNQFRLMKPRIMMTQFCPFFFTIKTTLGFWPSIGQGLFFSTSERYFWDELDSACYPESKGCFFLYMERFDIHHSNCGVRYDSRYWDVQIYSIQNHQLQQTLRVLMVKICSLFLSRSFINKKKVLWGWLGSKMFQWALSRLVL